MASERWDQQSAMSTFVDSFQGKTTESTIETLNSDNQLCRDDLFKLKNSTNPFCTPSVYDDNIEDSYSFFENVLGAGQDLISFDDHRESKNTNPFLEPYSTSDTESNSCNDIKHFENHETCNGLNTTDSIESCDDKITMENLTNNFSIGDVFQDSSKSYKDFVEDSSLDSVNECQIKNYFDCKEWKVGEVITLRVSNIYHLHRFWIVVRYKELEIFMEQLYEFYSKNKESLRIKQASVNLYCVVSLNNLFYRAIVISTPSNDPHRLKVFALDYGTVLIVFKDEVYFLLDRLYSVPQFAVRSSLAYIFPKDHQTWWSEAVRKFDQFSSHKVLIGHITAVNKQMKVLELNLGETPMGGYEVVYYNELLIDDDYAQYIFDKRDSNTKNRLKTNLQHLHLHPTFHMIESGKVPSSLYHFESLQSTVAFNVLYDQYCSTV